MELAHLKIVNRMYSNEPARLRHKPEDDKNAKNDSFHLFSPSNTLNVPRNVPTPPKEGGV